MKKTIAIIGGGASSLLLAAFLDEDQFDVTIYEKNKSLARKFLVAGKGGFNLTHSEPIHQFVERYTPASFLKEALLAFDNEQLRRWLDEIGIPTFIGSSKRVYPQKGIKPIRVLKAILSVLANKNVAIKYEHNWTGWNDENDLVFNGTLVIQADYRVFALGGGSWKITGSDGGWLDVFAKKGIEIQHFQAANCAYDIKWPIGFISKNEGKPLKNMAISCAEKTQKGELVITQSGLEGNAIYALSPQIQQQLNHENKATIYLDLKSALSEELILKRILSSREKTSNILRKELNLNPVKLSLLKEYLDKETFLSPRLLARKIKKLPLIITAAAPLDEAISTTGGLPLHQVNAHYELKKLNKHYCIGEMLDWNAPTGGYLLQACFSMAVYLASFLNKVK